MHFVAQECRDNLACLAQRGLRLTSYCSGKGSAETIIAHIAAALQEQGMVSASQTFQCRACVEFDPVAQRVLAAHTGLSSAQHHFGDINDQVTSTVKATFDKLEGSSKLRDRASEQRSSDHDNIYDSMKELLGDMGKAALTERAFCHKHGTQCLLFEAQTDKQAPLQVVVAGNPCRDWSRRGKQLRMAGQTARPWHIFVAQIRANAESIDIVLCELTDCVPESLYRESFGDLFVLCSSVVSPKTLGYPMSRPRRYTIMVNAHRCSTTGSFQALMDMFCTKPQFPASDYFMAPRIQVQSTRAQLARKRGHVFAAGQDVPDEFLLSPSAFRRLQEWQELLASRPDKHDLLWDFGQNPGFSLCGPCVPTLTESSGCQIFGVAANREMIALEHMSTMGQHSGTKPAAPLTE